MASMVPGEDSESDEEINTEHLQSLVLTPDGSLTGPGYRRLMQSSQQKTAGIVMGEESETDEEDEEDMDQPDGSGTQEEQTSLHSGESSTQGSLKEEPMEVPIPLPKSLLHQKLRERNESLRKNIVDRIIKLYRITCRNLTIVNNNLSKAQGTIEMVNSNLKRGEHELSELNSILTDINMDARGVAPNLSMTLPTHTHSVRKSPSPMRQRLLKGVPRVFQLAASAKSASSSSSVPVLPSEPQEGRGIRPTIPEGGDSQAKPEGQGSAGLSSKARPQPT